MDPGGGGVSVIRVLNGPWLWLCRCAAVGRQSRRIIRRPCRPPRNCPKITERVRGYRYSEERSPCQTEVGLGRTPCGIFPRTRMLHQRDHLSHYTIADIFLWGSVCSDLVTSFHKPSPCRYDHRTAFHPNSEMDSVCFLLTFHAPVLLRFKANVL